MHSNFITDLINLPDLVATDLIQTEEYLFFVAIPKVDHVKCPVCGKKVDKLHDRRVQLIQDVPYHNRKVTIRLEKKRYSCSRCGKRSPPKKLNSISKYLRKIERFKFYFLKQTDGRDYLRIARENDLTYTSIKNSVNTQIDTIIEKVQLDVYDNLKVTQDNN